jgi:hypothetical protein
MRKKAEWSKPIVCGDNDYAERGEGWAEWSELAVPGAIGAAVKENNDREPGVRGELWSPDVEI